MSIGKVILIGGCERSGTTMLGDLIGSAATSITTPESQFKLELISIFNNRGVDAALAYLAQSFRFKIWRMKLDSERFSDCTSGTQFLLRLIELYAESRGKHSPLTWIDHTPENINIALRLQRHLPQIKIVHIVRDGRAVAASVIPLTWGPNTIIAAADWWSQKIAAGLALSTFHQSSIFTVRYEDLLAGDQSQWRKLLEFLDEPSDNDALQSVLAGGGLEVPQYTADQHRLVGKGVVSARAEAWRKVLTPRQIEIFEYYAGHLLESIGYERQYHDPRPPSRIERMRMGEWPLRLHFRIGKKIKWIARRVRTQGAI
ncbi:sulfotransferase [Mycolicibacterium elephantis]